MPTEADEALRELTRAGRSCKALSLCAHEGPAIAHAWTAQTRLHHKAKRLLARGKRPTAVTTAVARELAGFVWAVWRLPETPAAPAPG